MFDRVTGEPVWPIEERPVAPSNVPGERLSATQPFPTKPPPYDRQGVTVDDLIDFTPELRAEAERIVSNYRLGPIYTSPSVADPSGPFGTLMLPSTGGGSNWPGGSLDPETGIIYQYSTTQVVSLGLVNDPERSDMDYIRGQPPDVSPTLTALNVQGLPLIKPPWGRITAIDLNRGEILWQVPHGATPDHVTGHPALTGVSIPRTGRPGRVGTLVTKTLVIAGEAGVFTTPSGQRGVKRPRFSWTRIKGESNVQGGGENGSVEGRGTGRGIGTDGGSPEGDWSPCRRRGGRGGLPGAGAAVERQPEARRGAAAAAWRIAGGAVP